jgi:CHAD domain-containing protein
MASHMKTYGKEQLGKYLEAQANVIASLSPKVFQDLTGEPVHSLRVATRRAQAVVWILKNCPENLRFKKLHHELHGLGRSLGGVRELDVAIADAKSYGINCTGLKSKRKTAQKKLHTKLGRGSRDKLEKHFASAVVAIHAMNPVSMVGVRDKLREQLAARLKQKIDRPKDLHELRITMKKARYVLESMGRSVDPISGLQEVLGNAHDLATLQALTGNDPAVLVEQKLLNATAVRLAKPAIRFAIAKLGDK